MLSIDDLVFAQRSEIPVQYSSVHTICQNSVWFCSDQWRGFWCVMEVDSHNFALVVFTALNESEKYSVARVDSEIASVDHEYDTTHPLYSAMWHRARAAAIGSAVATSLGDAYELYDEPTVVHGFLRNFSDGL